VSVYLDRFGDPDAYAREAAAREAADLRDSWACEHCRAVVCGETEHKTGWRWFCSPACLELDTAARDLAECEARLTTVELRLAITLRRYDATTRALIWATATAGVGWICFVGSLLLR